MNVLLACEESGIVRDEFYRLGHFAMSCDLLGTSSPGNHYQGDVTHLLDGDWDLIIAFPPCTFLCSSGLHWNSNPDSYRYGGEQTEAALDFVRLLLGSKCKRIALENPRGCIGTRIMPATQTV